MNLTASLRPTRGAQGAAESRGFYAVGAAPAFCPALSRSGDLTGTSLLENFVLQTRSLLLTLTVAEPFLQNVLIFARYPHRHTMIRKPSSAMDIQSDKVIDGGFISNLS